MIEREGDRDALNVVRPDGGHFPGGVCDENVSLEQDGQENVEMTMELCGEEFGERKPTKKVQDPKLPWKFLNTISAIYLADHGADITSEDGARRIHIAGCPKSPR